MYNREEKPADRLLNILLDSSDLDAHEIINALKDSVDHGFVKWGIRKELIVKLITNPEPKDIVQMITHSEALLKPLEEWIMMERKINTIRKDSISKYEYYATEYRCSQLQNFILLLKLY